MIETEFKRLTDAKRILCDSCMEDIKEEQPHFKLWFSAIGQTVNICEDCGNDLQNDMSDEYSKFVDLGL